MNSEVCYITGSDTGVGKTLLAALLTRHLLDQGVRVRAVKPLASGGRDDAVALRACQPGVNSLEDINPWVFTPPVTPLLAARNKGLKVRQATVMSFLNRVGRGCDLMLVEGAGGLLSPLGEGFSGRELIVALQASPIVVCPNRLGAINQSLLVLEALPRALARRAHVVLMNGPRKDASTRSNGLLLKELSAAADVHEVPWLGAVVNPVTVPIRGALKRAVAKLATAL